MGDARDRELQYLIDRRRFLGLSGSVAAAGLLAACGLSSNSSSTPGTTGGTGTAPSPSPLPPVGGDLNLYTWEGYDLTKQFKSWREQNGITQNLKFITQPEEVPTVLKGPGGDKWDLSYGDNVVLTDYKNLGLISPLTLDEVPNLASRWILGRTPTGPTAPRHGRGASRGSRTGRTACPRRGAGTTSLIPSTKAAYRRSTER
jgi:spermidine/putrescine-binding protein